MLNLSILSDTRLRKHSLLALAVGFEPTGHLPQQISSLRRYSHFGTPAFLLALEAGFEPTLP